MGSHSQGGGLTLWLGMTSNDILVSGQLGRVSSTSYSRHSAQQPPLTCPLLKHPTTQ